MPRHQTLRVAIDPSYILLSDSEQILLPRLSVFAGGWTLEATEAVCTDEGVDPGKLLHKSLKLRLEIGDRAGIAWCLEKLAELSLMQGQEKNSPERNAYSCQAVRLFGASRVLRSPVGSVIDLVDQPEYERQRDDLKCQLEEAAFSASWEEGQKLTVEQAVAYATENLKLG